MGVVADDVAPRLVSHSSASHSSALLDLLQHDSAV